MITPIYKIVYKFTDEKKTIFVKDESFNITGSIKYRPAKNIIKKAYENHIIDKNTMIFDVTSGNMGIALAAVAKEYGNPSTFYMPKFMSEERKTMLKDLGANFVLTNSFEEAFSLAENNKDGYYCRQFENPYNVEAYFEFADEILKKIPAIPAFIAGVGTGGTLIGTGRYLKEKIPTRLIAVEPKESLILSTGINHGEHEIQGLSDGFIPQIYDESLVDEIISVSSTDSISMAQALNSKFSLHVGISSGTNFLASVLSKIDGAVTVFPDSSDRYKSTRLSDKKIHSEIVDLIELISLELL